MKNDIKEHKIADKLRIKRGSYVGTRGLLSSITDPFLEVTLSTQEKIQILPEDVTNYSLAARRAWKSMPKKAGRPQLAKPRKKMVSIRLDIDIWRQLEEAVSKGLIVNREQTVNNWLRENLNALNLKSGFDKGELTELKV